MNKLYHITAFYDRFDEERDLTSAFNSGKDWLRYAPNCWFVSTNEDATAWRERLKKVAGPNGNILIFEITNAEVLNGFLAENVWDWLKKNGLKIETR